jgi:outer membrane putative beta-barrel porin/alpha-amylase
VLFVLVHIGTSSASAANAGCPQSGAEIATDRPDVTNSSLVVPTGSLQNESGVDLTSKDGARILDGTNNRLRSGIAPCLEVLVDLPTYFATVRGQASSGFSDVAPAVKWQISPVPGVLDLSITAGVGLPTGTTAVAGPGVQPYLQVPWSRELGDGWGISGMLTSFFIPADPTSKFCQQVTFAIEKKISDRSDLFVEYVGGHAAHGGASQAFNTGGAYHFTPTQQIDFHFAVGLNRNAPTWIFGVGYSFRLDGLFAGYGNPVRLTFVPRSPLREFVWRRDQELNRSGI